MSLWRSYCLASLFIALSACQETVFHVTNSAPPTTKALMKAQSIPNRSRYPYVVSIGTNVKGYYKHLCVGVIISDGFLLTAAHCLKTLPNHKPAPKYVAGGDDFLGSRNQTRFFIVQVEWHPRFRMLGGHDIAVARVYPKFTLDNKRFRSIQFKVKPRKDVDERVTMLGWGRATIGRIKKLQETPYLTMQNWLCKHKYRFVFLTKTDICAMHLRGPKGACDGDSGAPLMDVANERLVGLLSYGRKACTPLQPYAFTRVSEYSKWIQETMDGMNVGIMKANHTRWKDAGNS
ncbi:mite allergen Eur m 3 [Drosophila biarmipes]|uniref:mite allergen Eur m 3 n=1 Tax=Drosophila biarmipes TaxID=125945 RepID=UPI0007E8ACFF|nr:mite allergen Eur m 3 [Drosophila biarmipes]